MHKTNKYIYIYNHIILAMFLGYGIFEATYNKGLGIFLEFFNITAKQALESKIPDVNLRTLILDNMNNKKIKSLINEYLELEDIIENLSSIERHLLLKKTDIKNKIDTFIKDDSISKEIINILKKLKRKIGLIDIDYIDYLYPDLEEYSRKLKIYINDTTVISNEPLSEFIKNLEESMNELISLQKKFEKANKRDEVSFENYSKMINQQFAKIINNGTNDTLKSYISTIPKFQFEDYTHTKKKDYTMKEDISECVINYFKAKKEFDEYKKFGATSKEFYLRTSPLKAKNSGSDLKISANREIKLLREPQQ